ncbi:DUF1349 domain-containing protein, partial [Streptomyces sp. t39]
LSPDLPTVCTVVTRGHSDDANSFTVEGESVWLRVSRTGNAFAFHASTDGERWTFVRIFALGDEESARAALVGFMAQSPVGQPLTRTRPASGVSSASRAAADVSPSASAEESWTVAVRLPGSRDSTAVISSRSV